MVHVTFRKVNDIQHHSVYRAIYNFAKDQGFDVGWGTEAGIQVSAETSGPGIIFMPHGVSYENFNAVRKGALEMPRTCLLPGPYWKENLYVYPPPQAPKGSIPGTTKIDPSMYPKEKLKVVGWPKSDLLSSPQRARKVREKWLSSLNLPYDQTVLFSGSWYMSDFAEITAELEVNLIHKPHISANVISSPPFKGATKDQRLCFHDTKKKYEHFKHVSWVDPTKLEDITELFPVSDLCISNPGSSVATEFMVTGKPVISFTHVKVVSGFEFNDDELPAVISREDRMKESIAHCLENPDELKRQREAWLEKMIYKPDGNASKRAWEAIMELVG